MPKLADVLYDAQIRARNGLTARVALAGGLEIVIDNRRPDQRSVRFGRRVPHWPGSAEITTCRRNGLEIQPGAATQRYERAGYCVIEYTWPVG